MDQLVMRRIVRDRLAEADLPPLSESVIDSYIYEIVVELPDREALALLEDRKVQVRTREQTPTVRSVLSRVMRLIECDVILRRWGAD